MSWFSRMKVWSSYAKSFSSVLANVRNVTPSISPRIQPRPVVAGLIGRSTVFGLVRFFLLMETYSGFYAL